MIAAVTYTILIIAIIIWIAYELRKVWDSTPYTSLFSLLFAGMLIIILVISISPSLQVLLPGSPSPVQKITPYPIITAVNTYSSTVPSTTTAVSVSAQDPIIGVWRHCGNYCDSMKDTYQFNADGMFSKSSIYFETTDTGTGTWRAIGDNSYRCVYLSGITFTIKYDPATNSIYETDSKYLLFTPVN